MPSIFNWSKQATPRRTLKRKQLSSIPPEVSNTEQEESMETDECAGDIERSTDVCTESDEKDKQIEELKRQLEEKSRECENIKSQLELERFGINRFSYDDNMIKFYTGFQTYLLFIAFYRCTEPTAKNMQSAYYKSSDTISLSGRKRCMMLIDELSWFLCRLRAGLIEQDLSVRFNCSVATVSRKIITWANFLYFVLGSIPIWLPKEVIQNLMPECFQSLYPNTRVIIDCTEIKTQQPASLVLNSQLYSSYKGTNTFKALLGIAPHGAVTFISSLYTGCMSDIEVTKISRIFRFVGAR